MKGTNVIRETTVIRRREGVESTIITGSYEMQVPVRDTTPVLLRNKAIAKNIKRKAADKAARRDSKINLNSGGRSGLTKHEFENWAMGLRIVRREGVQGGSRFSMNEMIEHMVAFGYKMALNW